MLVEKFDFLEFLRLAIAQGDDGKKISKRIVLGEIALLHKHARMWAELLIEKVGFERIALITLVEKIYETTMINGVSSRKRIDDIPGKVEIKQGNVQSANLLIGANDGSNRLGAT